MYYPAFLDLKGKRVLLFGAGAVALRKAKVLVKSEVHLTVVSREFSKPFLKWAKSNRVKLVHGIKIPKLNQTWLVVAATSDPEFNHKIYQTCQRSKIFVNVVDDPKNSSFIVPSIVRRGQLQLAISTGGASPSLAKIVRKKLEKQFGPEYARLLRQLARVRTEAKKKISFKERKDYLRKQVVSRLNVIARHVRSRPKQSLRSPRLASRGSR